MTIDEAFATVIVQARKKKGMNQTELAKRVNIARPHVSCLERGVHGVKLETFLRIAYALDMTGEEMMLRIQIVLNDSAND